MDYLISTRDDNVTITFMEDDGSVISTINGAHINYKRILKAVRAAETAGGEFDEDAMRELLDPVDKIAERLATVSTRFTYEDEKIKFDGKPVLDMFANQLVRVLKETDEDDDTQKKHLAAVAKFGEKLMGNTSYHVRNQLFQFVSNGDLTITEDGDFLAYKGVLKVEDEDEDGNKIEKFTSVHSGPADVVAVDGVLQPEGKVHNPLGAVVTMERRLVDDRPDNHCSNGLHCGFFDYARSFSREGLLMVAVNPAHVVTVPSDHNAQKLRVEQYRVLEATEYEYTKAVYTPSVSPTACADDDLCPCCGGDAPECADCDGCEDCCEDCCS
jgi:hypothetical protein